MTADAIRDEIDILSREISSKIRSAAYADRNGLTKLRDEFNEQAAGRMAARRALRDRLKLVEAAEAR